MYKCLVFTRGEIRAVRVVFENKMPKAVMSDGSEVPLDPLLLRHIDQEKPEFFYLPELPPS
jgi:hypothetical protein